MHYICSMNTENPSVQMRKGVLELCILAIIAEGDAYASDILGRLKEARLIVVEGTLYPLLTRLKNEGFTEYSWVESKAGPPRKYHRITGKGSSHLDALRADWLELVGSVEAIVLNHQNEAG